jgi:GPH family glycoside/pentoside/hexuronide:cation symporter
MTDKISLTTRLAYASPSFALAVLGIPLFIYIPKFYTDVVGMDISLLAWVIMGVRIFDAVSDPLIGLASDQTNTRFGRRRPYMFLGALALAAVIWQLFTPPETDAIGAAWWFSIFMFTLSVFWTAVQVPYESLGPEITFDYHQRTELFAWRDGFLILGTLFAAATPAILDQALDLGPGAADQRRKFLWFATIYAPLLVALVWWCVWKIREKPRAAKESWPGLANSLRIVIRNRPFLILLAGYTISAFGANLPATLILYYVQYVLGSESADMFLLIYFCSGILMLPAWVHLAKKTGKKKAWLIAMALNTGAFVGVFFLGRGDLWAYGILTLVSGLGFGATVALPSAMQADVIDYDEYLSGGRREGQYIGIWSIARKLASALGIGLALALVGAAGYEPNLEQSDQVVLMLRIMYALVPCLCNAAAFFIALAYPIGSREHGRILEAVEARRQGLPVADPLAKE